MLLNGQKSGFRFTIVLFIVCLTCHLFPSAIIAQAWDQVGQINGTNTASFASLSYSPEGSILISGSFNNKLQIAAEDIETTGLDDVFLARYHPGGTLEWVKTGGSTSLDNSVDVAFDAEGNLYWAGQFWISATFDTLQLSLSQGSKGIFLIKYTAAGEILWGKSIEGSGLKVLGDICSDPEGNLYLTGYFQEDLVFPDTTIFAEGFQSMFLLKYDRNGQLLWARSAGYEGELRGKRLAYSPVGSVIVGGDLQGKAVFGTDSIQSFTADHDVFIASYSLEGTPLWGRRAGGVFEDNCNALDVDEQGNIFVAGTFIGVMKLEEGLEIQTDGFNENLFVLRYSTAGNPDWARSLGSQADEEAFDLVSFEDQLFVTGHYFGDLEIDGNKIYGEEDRFNAFLAGFSNDGSGLWLKQARSSSYIEGRRLAPDPQGRIWLGGNFSDLAFFDQIKIGGGGLNNIYWARLDPLINKLEPLPLTSFTLFPNPTTDKIFFTKDQIWEQIHLYDAAGRLVLAKNDSHFLSLKDLPPSIYYLKVFSQDHHFTFKVLKQ